MDVGEQTCTIRLWRSNRADREVGIVAEAETNWKPGQVWRVVQDYGYTRITLNNREVLSFQDLLPIDRPRQHKISFAYNPDFITIENLRLARPALPELISSLDLAETTRPSRPA